MAKLRQAQLASLADTVRHTHHRPATQEMALNLLNNLLDSRHALIEQGWINELNKRAHVSC